MTPSKQTNSDGPSAAPMAEPIAPSVSARPVVDPVADPVVEPAPAAEGPETQPAKAEEVGSQNDDDGGMLNMPAIVSHI